MRPHQFAKELGVSVETLRRWDRTGKLSAKRTPSNHRYYTEEDLAVARGLKPTVENRLIKVYCRVSSQKQKSELSNQKNAMEPKKCDGAKKMRWSNSAWQEAT